METAFKISDKPGIKPQLNPDHIMQIGLGFWASKTILAAIKFQLFTVLSEKPLTAEDIRKKLNLHHRSYLDFLDALVSLNFLNRDGDTSSSLYSNTADTELFLDRKKPSYIGGILEMANNRLYKYWGNLEEALITGNPQNEQKASNKDDQFGDIYADKENMKVFLAAMAGIQLGSFMMLAERFDFSPYKTLCDAGGALGALSVQVARKHPHIKCISYDLPAVESTAKDYIAQHGLESRIDVASGSFFENIPQADVITMGNILHDWSEKEKISLIKKAFEALPIGGAFICIENVIDDHRRKNTFGLLMSLNMLIETKEGRDYTFNEFTTWAKQAGFSRTEIMPLAGPTSAAIAYK